MGGGTVAPHDAASAFRSCRIIRRGFGPNDSLLWVNYLLLTHYCTSNISWFKWKTVRSDFPVGLYRIINRTLFGNETFAPSSNDFLVVPTFTMLFLLRVKPFELNHYWTAIEQSNWLKFKAHKPYFIGIKTSFI